VKGIWALENDFITTTMFSSYRCTRCRCRANNYTGFLLMLLTSLQKLLIRYTFDVMLCKMNLAKKILKTISGTKDTYEC
jgi:hypothetical protein